MVQGRINIGSSYLVCYESLRYIFQQCKGFLDHPDMIEEILKTEFNDPFKSPSVDDQQKRKEVLANNIPFLKQHYKSWTQYIVVDQTTKRDSLKDPALKPFLQDKLALKGESEETDKKKSDQMIASDRLIMGGAKLYSRWDFNGTNIEEGFIYDALMEFSSSPYLGGKGNRGNGLVTMEFWYNTKDEQGHLLSLGDSQIVNERAQNKLKDYHEYLADYREYLETAKDSNELKTLLGA